jgi:dephospho-CoA kinase
MGGSKIKSRVIGLMGNSGSGKSTVAGYLEKLGAYIIDADAISHEICEIGKQGNREVREAFGSDYFRSDGSLDRRRLGAYVFAHPDELERLEKILHPLILAEVKRRLGATRAAVTVIDCALLTAVGLDQLVDEVWLVQAPNAQKLQRIQKRDEIEKEHAENRLQRQQPECELRKYAHRIIENTGTLEELRNQVEELYHEQEQGNKNISATE